MNWKNLLLFVAMFVGVFFLWDTVVIYPIKVFVVFFHEISHGLAAVLTGGGIQNIQVNSDLSGVTYTWGGSGFLTLSAGYLGSMVWGSAILLAASRLNNDRPLMGALGLILLFVTVRFVPLTLNAFGFVFGLVVGAVMLGLALKAPESVNDFILRFLGFTSCLYVVLDIKEDLLSPYSSSIQSDATMLAQMTGIPAMVWGGLWFLIALGVLGFTLYFASRTEQKRFAAKRSLAI
ncbi:MAG: M50 family metallopeptidase [Abditibacteriales bacterium]|nr:M50 family metallopeptidase [Abditibacteriales bacterium]MDW8365420.1 M50 family metallopeptidase [Abditibacteriales bacterium]